MSRKRKNILIEQAEIKGLAAEGKAFTHYQEKIVFVPGNQVAPGDIVDLKVTRQKRRYLEAVPTKFHQYSELRLPAFCEHFGYCGGCKWQHLPYQYQLKQKRQQVVDNLERIAKVELPEIPEVLPASDTRYYRNKLEFTFSNRAWLTSEELQAQKAEAEANAEELPPIPPALGFHVPKFFDKVLNINDCHLQAEPSNALRLEAKRYALEQGLEFFDLRQQVGFLRNMVIRQSSNGELMLILIFFREDKAEIKAMLEHFQQKFPEITSLYYIINSKGNDSYQDLSPEYFAGKAYIEEEMEGLRFRISPKAFYQTNSQQAYELYKVARDFADLKGQEIVYDLYTGTGTIASFVARQAQQVIGIEYVEAAIADAKINAEVNGIKNAHFFAGDMKEVLNETFIQTHGKPEVIITDPPRAGMHEEVIKTILRAAPQKIVYVSCNVATQARDLALLDESYRVEAVQPVDMFPHTHHIENVVKLVKR